MAPKDTTTHGPRFGSAAKAKRVEDAVKRLDAKTTAFESGPSLDKGIALCEESRDFLNTRAEALADGE